MRLQLSIVLCLLSGLLYAQQTDTLLQQAPEIKIDFLLGYYEQDGDNAAVTGGTGTEELTDLAGKIIVYVPVDSVSELWIETGINHYSSASTDRIDFNVSSASSVDNHLQLSAKYRKQLPEKQLYLSFEGGAGIESDYLSKHIGLGLESESKDLNNRYGISFTAFFDRWIIYLPVELRDEPAIAAQIPTDKRNSISLGLNYERDINQQLSISFSADPSVQQGLLSTPFHRIYFNNDSLAIERLPQLRWRLPVGARLSYYLSDFMVVKLNARLYTDNWGVNAGNIGLELPLRLTNFWSIYPFYRLYGQTASKYFQPYKGHVAGGAYFTSDYDLSAFSSHKLGVGLSYRPLWGLFRNAPPKGNPFAVLRNFAFRYAYYSRSDGLKANQLSINVSLSL